MDDLKDKMYNYEVSPPHGVWETIASGLDHTTAPVVSIDKKKPQLFYYSLAAASAVIILFCVIFFTNSSRKNKNEELVSSPSSNQTNNSINKKDDVIMTVPSEEKNNTRKNKTNDNLLVKNNPQKLNSPENKNITDTKKIDSLNQSAINKNPEYITIANPQGQSVKVSSKMASLMDSSNESSPSKPIWNKKISDWKEIMKANTLSPTPGNFLDIIELTKTVKDKK